MKTALVRILTMATLATGLAASAAEPQSNQTSANETTMVAANTQQEGCATGQKEKKQKKAKSQRDDDRTEQEKEFDHTLMGYFG